MLSLIKKTILILLISIFAIIATVSIYIYFNQEKITNYIVSTLNNTIDTKISASKIDLSVFKSFPYATISFSNIEIASAKKYAENNLNAPLLLKAEKLNIHFNLYQLLFNKLIIKGIGVEKGYTNILFDDQNRNNYTFWKENASTAKSGFDFSLKDISLREVQLNYVQISKNLYVQTLLAYFNIHGTIKTNLLDNTFELSAESSSILANKHKYMFKNEIYIKTDLFYSENKILIKKAKLNYENLKLVSSFTLDQSNYRSNFSLTCTTNEMVSLFNSFMPKDLVARDGSIMVNGSIDGNLKNSDLNNYNVNLIIQDANLKYHDYPLQHIESDINLKYSNSELLIKTEALSFNYSNTSAKIAFNIEKGHKSNHFWSTIAADLDLSDLDPYLDSTLCNIYGGKSKLELQIESDKLENWKLSDLKMKGNIKIDDLSGDSYYKNFTFESVNGQIEFNNDLIVISESEGKLNNNNLSYKGSIENLFPFIEDNKYLKITGNIETRTLNISDLFLKNNVPNDSSNYKIAGDLFWKSKGLKINKIDASDISCQLIFDDTQCQIKNLIASFCDGQIENSKIQFNYAKNLSIISELNAKKLNIKSLFSTFDNFGQNQLKAENITGTLNGTANVSLSWNSVNTLEYNKITGTANVEILDGKLIKFKPISKLSDYLEIDDINNIKFSKLKNTIFVSNNQISIPDMEIFSSALSMNISGQHSFNNDYEYHFNMLLSDILFPKIKKKKLSEFGPVEEDNVGKSRIYLKLKGSGENFKFSYDGKKAMNSFSQKMGDEKKKVRNMIAEDFHLFQKDSTYKDQETRKVPKIEENELTTQPENKSVEKSHSKKKNVLVEWKDE